jgi:hypothetical protein
MKMLFSLLAIAIFGTASAQFAPQAGNTGSTAVPAAGIIAWANNCSVQRGYLDIANPTDGTVTAGEPANATGASDGTIVSLGDSGVATLTFSGHIYNGAGPDFAVFENGFKDPSNGLMAFLELAFVEVSSDGINFTRFPATSNTPVSPQIPVAGTYMDAALINNLAGKYVSGYGTPFDLNELVGTPGLDVNHITHVRIVDVVGSVSGLGSVDNEGHRINDPYPTNIPTGGFDLEAVGAINIMSTGIENTANTLQAAIYPNPATDEVYITLSSATNHTITVSSITGSILQQQQATSNTTLLNIAPYPSGIYYITISGNNGNQWVGKVVKY